MKLSRLLVLLVLLLALAGCGSDDDEAGGDTTAPETTAATTGGSAAGEGLKIGLVTDIGGLDDRSFNFLANKGLERAKTELGVEGRVVISEAEADYVPNLTTLARQDYDLVIAVGFLMAAALEEVSGRFPDVNFAIIDSSQSEMKTKPKNVRGLLFKEQEAGYLVGYLAGLITKAEGGSKQVIGSVGGLKIPPVDRYIAGYQAGAEAANSGITTAERLLAGLRRPGQVQGARPRPDRTRRNRRLPGRGPVRPRRALGGGGEEHARDRRRRRPGLPRRPHRDERAEEGRRGRLPDGAGGRGRRLQRRRGHDLRRRLRCGRDRRDLADRPAGRGRGGQARPGRDRRRHDHRHPRDRPRRVQR